MEEKAPKEKYAVMFCSEVTFYQYVQHPPVPGACAIPLEQAAPRSSVEHARLVLRHAPYKIVPLRMIP